MIRDYAKISKPLTNALRKDIKINTENKEYREAFEQLKLLLQNNPILQLPDYSVRKIELKILSKGMAIQPIEDVSWSCLRTKIARNVYMNYI
ncbi:hypothetical protein, partial [Klebsiella pneumoniae]|uniref:hypothetical protein n=1 Tax=Klebsiella pneumoniae TaxID=573 RepID=UPI00405552F2